MLRRHSLPSSKAVGSTKILEKIVGDKSDQCLLTRLAERQKTHKIYVPAALVSLEIKRIKRLVLSSVPLREDPYLAPCGAFLVRPVVRPVCPGLVRDLARKDLDFPRKDP